MPGRVATRQRVHERLQLPHVEDEGVQNAFKMVVDAIYSLQVRRQTISDTSSETHIVNGVLTFGREYRLGSSTGPLVMADKGDPNGVVTAPAGSLYIRTDGGAGTCFYVKETTSGNTGWAAK